MDKSSLLISIKSLLKKEPFLTHTEIAKKLKIDKARASGYLEALVDLDHILVKRVGNSKGYYLKEKVK